MGRRGQLVGARGTSGRGRAGEPRPERTHLPTKLFPDVVEPEEFRPGAPPTPQPHTLRAPRGLCPEGAGECDSLSGAAGIRGVRRTRSTRDPCQHLRAA